MTGRFRPTKHRSANGARTAPLWGALLVLLVLGACSPVRTVEAARLLADIARLDVSHPVGRSALAYAGQGAVRRAHLYRPAEVRAALVVVPGAAEAGMQDPRLIDFAEALRERGFLVLVPELAGDDPLRVSAADKEPIADAVRYLTGPMGFERVGLAALSYAVGPTVLAALDEDIRGRIDYILAIGGYHDIVAALTYITTGAFRPGPETPWRRAEVDPRAKWVFLRANASRLDDPADARLLGAIARGRLADPPEDTAALAARLGPEGRAVHRLLVNRDPDRVPALLDALPRRLREEIRALDLATRDLTRLEADLLLIHGRGDPLVPFTESLGLARAAGEDRARVYLVDGLAHVDIGELGPDDVATLLRAAYRLLLERDTAAAASGQARDVNLGGLSKRPRTAG